MERTPGRGERGRAQFGETAMKSTTPKDGTTATDVTETSFEPRPADEFTNFETWTTYRWLTDDEGSRRTWQERASEILRAAGGSADWAVQQLAEEILESVDAERSSNVASLAEDLLQAARSEVV